MVKFIALVISILSSIGVFLCKDDKDSWDDKSIIALSVISSIGWAIFFTFLF